MLLIDMACALPALHHTFKFQLRCSVRRYMEATLEHKRLQCKELVATDRLSCVKTLTRLFDALATPELSTCSCDPPSCTSHIRPLCTATWAIVNGGGGVVMGIEQHAHHVDPPGCACAAGP